MLLLILVETARDIGVIAGAFVACVTALGLAYTRLIRPAWRLWIDTVNRTKRLLEIAEAELTANAGSSMRDRVAHVAVRLDDLDQAVEDAIAVNREHMHSSGSLLFDVSTTLADMARQLDEHTRDADVHMRKTIYSPKQRDEVRRMRDQRQHLTDQQHDQETDDADHPGEADGS